MKSNYGIRWILQQTKGKRREYFLLILFVCLLGVSVIGVSLLMKAFIDIATGQGRFSLKTTVVLAVLDLLVLGVSQIVVSLLQSKLFSDTELKLRKLMLNKLMHIPMLEFDSKPTNLYFTRITMDAETIARFLSDTTISSIFSECLTFVISLILIFVLNWKMALVLVTIFPLFMLLMIKFSPKINSVNEIISREEENNRNIMQEALDKAILFKAYDMSANIQQQMEKQYGEKKKQNYHRGLFLGIMGFMNNFMGVGMFIIALGFGATLVLNGETTVGSLIAMVNLVSFYYGPFMHVSDWMAAVSGAKVSASRIGEILDVPDEASSTVEELSLGKPNDVKLQAKDVSFAYPQKENILDHIETTFEKGKITALVGESGSGKSTLLKTLMGLYTPTAGQVELVWGDSVCYSQ